MVAVSQDAKDFLLKGFQRDQNKRATVKQFLAHPWLRDAKLPTEVELNSNNEMQTAILLRAGHVMCEESI